MLSTIRNALVLATVVGSIGIAAETAPDLYTLQRSGFIIGPGNDSTTIHNSWKSETAVMKELDVYDSVVNRLEEVMCGNEKNKSVLLIGEPTDAYRWVFARFAIRASEACKDLWHVEMDTNKIEAGNQYVGSVEKYWNDNVLKPLDQKMGIAYFRSLGRLIGLGSHSNDDTGIESELAANLSAGRLKTIAFMDKYEYQYHASSKNAYVLNSFAEKINIPAMADEHLDAFVARYISVLAPRVKLEPKEAKYLFRTVGYYQPNILEPQRSLTIVNAALRKVPAGEEEYKITLEDLRNAIFEYVQVPKWLLNRDFDLIRQLRGKLDGDVVGVTEGKNAAVRLAQIGYVAGRTDEKPIASHMYVGPTGTGKSYLAKRLATYMEMKLITVDMTSYGTPESYDRFLDIMEKNLTLYPFAIYMFEEIDKADVGVLDRLYFMLDEGVFYDRHQRPLFARGAYIIMTTNAGEDIILEKKDDPNLNELVQVELQKKFRPSFLNRFDAITVFKPFTAAEFLQLSKTLLAKKASLLKSYSGWALSYDQKTIEFVAAKGQSARFGARPMERLIEYVISFGISEYQMQHGTLHEGSEIAITKLAGEKSFKIAVKGGKSVDFEVATDHNGGGKFSQGTNDIMEMFQQNRLY